MEAKDLARQTLAALTPPESISPAVMDAFHVTDARYIRPGLLVIDNAPPRLDSTAFRRACGLPMIGLTVVIPVVNDGYGRNHDD